MVVCSAQKVFSISVPANANLTYDDSSYTKSGYTYIGTVIYSFSATAISITPGYAGAGIGIRFFIHNFSTTVQAADIKYRHLYIKS